MQAIEPGIAVPGYVVANWAVLRLPEILRVNLGSVSDMVSSCCVMFPFIRTGMTEAYADNPKVFGRWQSRMLETHGAGFASKSKRTSSTGVRSAGNASKTGAFLPRGLVPQRGGCP
jgi:hypothetical protein